MTNAEWEIMRVIWRYERCTSKMIYDVLKKPLQWSESTVKTLLSRLVKKGCVTYDKKGKQFIYYACQQQHDLLVLMVKNALSYGCHQTQGKVLNDVLQHIEISVNDIQQIQTVLLTKEKTAPEQVACCCIVGQCVCCLSKETR